VLVFIALCQLGVFPCKSYYPSNFVMAYRIALLGRKTEFLPVSILKH